MRRVFCLTKYTKTLLMSLTLYVYPLSNTFTQQDVKESLRVLLNFLIEFTHIKAMNFTSLEKQTRYEIITKNGRSNKSNFKILISNIIVLFHIIGHIILMLMQSSVQSLSRH